MNSLFIEDHFNYIINLLRVSVDELSSFISRYKLETYISIVMYIRKYDDPSPAISISPDILEFFMKLYPTIDFDYYGLGIEDETE